MQRAEPPGARGRSTARGRFLTGMPPLELPTGPRRVRAWLPAGLDPTKPAPLLILFDGQNVFGDAGSFAGGWHAHEAVDRLSPRTTERPIVIGVDHGGVHRIRELGTSAAETVDAVVRQLLPFARAHLPWRGEVVLGGASLGGLAALVGWLRHPTVFQGALAMSPSLWFGHHALLRGITTGQIGIPATGRVYVDAGRRERGRMFTDAEHLAAALQAAGLGADRLMWRPDSKGAHHERHWRRRLPKALRFLFKRGVRA